VLVRLVRVRVAEDRAEEPALPGAGEHNGLIDAGEVVHLHPLLENVGDTPLLSVSGELSCPAGVEVRSARQSYDDLTAGASDEPDAPYVVRAQPGLPNGALVTCTLALADSREGELTPLPLRLGVRKGALLVSSELFVDDDDLGFSDGDGDGRVDPGEKVELVVDLRNDGAVAVPVEPIAGDHVGTSLGAQRVVAQLVSESELLEILHLDNPPVYADPLAPGATVRSAADFDLALSDAAEQGERVCFELDLDLVAGEDGPPLYRFVEWRCFEVSGPFGEACRPQPETCNERDDDCDGRVDEDLELNPCGTCGPVPEEICDDVDNDCDGSTDEDLEVDGDSDGHAGPGSCLAAPDCDDSNRAVHPGAAEACNGVDDDCDGDTDEGLPVNDCGTCGPVPEEICDGDDNDCDGDTDEDLEIDRDGDRYPGLGSCLEVTDCDDNNPGVHPGAGEQCNGVDDDCDRTTDEGCDAACAGAEVVPAQGDQAVSVNLFRQEPDFVIPCLQLAQEVRDVVMAFDLPARQRVTITGTHNNALALEMGLFLLADDCVTPVEGGCAQVAGANMSDPGARLSVTLDPGRYYLVVGDADPIGLPTGIELLLSF